MLILLSRMGRTGYNNVIVGIVQNTVVSIQNIMIKFFKSQCRGSSVKNNFNYSFYNT